MKKCITISLIFCMLLALASCGKTDTSSPENSISIDTENMEESEEAEYSESEQSEYTESEEEFITVDGSTIKNATGYHNGYNYVTFEDGTSAVFDKEGMEVARFPFAMEYEYTKWLSDDLLVAARDGVSFAVYYDEFAILSISEGILYDSTKDDEHDWTYLGGYGNTILVQRYLQGFNIDATYQIGFTDPYGTEPETWTNVADRSAYDYDLGEGMYLLNTGSSGNAKEDEIRLCNLPDRSIVKLSEYPAIYGGEKFYDGFVVSGSFFNYIRKMDTSGNFSPVFEDNLEADIGRYAEGLFGIYSYHSEDPRTYGYYDINGNCVISFEEYAERYMFEEMGAFLNGHAGVVMEAKDNGSKFYACFDSQGNLMYEPFMCEDGSSDIELIDGGYFLAKAYGADNTFYDVTGETYIPLTDDMSFLPDNVTFEGVTTDGDQYSYSEGIFTVKADLGTGYAHVYEPCYEFYQKDGTQIYLQMKVDPMDGEF